MSLDVFNPAATDQDVAQNAARDLPAGFSEAFDISLRGIGEWNSSNAYAIARERALATYYDDVKAKTGVQLPLYGLGGNVSIDDVNEALAKLPQPADQPEPAFPPLSEGAIDGMALARMAKARQDSRAFEHRETTWGGTAGAISGTLLAAMADPVNVATLPLGGSGNLPIALRALEFAVIGGGTEAVIAASNYSAREAAVPGSIKDIPGEIATATLFGGVVGGAFGGLQKWLGHGARPLPTTVREEVNAAASELQLQATNPFRTAAGEMAARDATIEATNALLRGEAVRAADNFPAAAVTDFAEAAGAKTPDQLALSGEKHLRPETFRQRPEVERLDPMPEAADDAASYWERRLETASPEERAAFGATDAAPPSGLRLVEAPEGGIYTPDQIKTAKGERYFKVVNADGETAAEILVRVDDTTARVEDILVPGKPREEGRGALGPTEMRSILRQFREANPEITKLTGKRVSGARMEGGYSLLDDASEVEVNLPPVVARDLSPEEVVKLAADPATETAVLRNLDRIRVEKPDADYSVQVRQADGSYQIVTRKLEDVMDELDGMESLAKELEACAIGMAAE